MAGILVAAWLAAVAALGLGLAQATAPLSFASCAELRHYLAGVAPGTQVRLAPASYECSEPVHLAVDGLSVDFGGSTVRLADRALRPAVLLGDLHTPPARRYRNITVRNLLVDGNRANQPFECWGGPCDPRINRGPYRQQRVNGITVNGCDDCAVLDAEVGGARSGGLVVVSSERLLIDGLLAWGAYFDGLAGYWTRDSVFRNVLVRDNDHAGFSFDLHFSNNRIERFESRGNRDHGMFIRLASGNSFVGGVFAGNRKHGVYFDRARPNQSATCASDTRFEDVTVRDSGLYGAWLDFACAGNHFVASQLIGNQRGCFGGREATRIGRSDDTGCTGPDPEQTAELPGT
jgi:Right handed beta helix region